MAPSAMTVAACARRRPARPVLAGRPRPAPPRSPPSPATSLRPARRRRRLQRAVDRADRQGARPRRATSSWSRADEVGWAASGRNGGFCAASLTHGLGNGLARWPGRDRHAGGARRPQPRRHRGGRRPLRHRLRLRAHRRDRRRHRAAPGRRAARSCAEEAAGLGLDRLDLPRPRRGARPGRLADLPRRAVGPRRRRHAQPGQPRLGPEAGLPAASASASTSTPRPPTSPPTAPGMAVRTPYGRVRARQVALGTNAFPSLVQRVRPYIVPVYDYALMTEPLSDAAARRHRLEEPPGPRRQRQPLPLLPLTADNRILWGGYDVVYHYGGRVARRVRPPPGDLREARPALLPLLPAAGGPALQPRLGRRDRHLLPLLARSSARRTAAGSPTPPATPASASAPPASAPR